MFVHVFDPQPCGLSSLLGGFPFWSPWFLGAFDINPCQKLLQRVAFGNSQPASEKQVKATFPGEVPPIRLERGALFRVWMFSRLMDFTSKCPPSNPREQRLVFFREARYPFSVRKGRSFVRPFGVCPFAPSQFRHGKEAMINTWH